MPHDNIIWRMRFACRINKTRDTHSEYVIRIVFPRQLLRKCASVLRHTCIAYLLFIEVSSNKHFQSQPNPTNKIRGQSVLPICATQSDQKISLLLMITVHKTRKNILNSFNQLELGITDSVSVSLVSPWPWRSAAKQSDCAK
jgi:hypothetical protein